MPPPGSQPSRASARETRPVQRLRYAASQPVQRRRPALSPPPPREEPAPIPDPDPDLHQEAGELELEEGGAEVQQQVQERVPVRLGTVGAEEIMELEELVQGNEYDEAAGAEAEVQQQRAGGRVDLTPFINPIIPGAVEGPPPV